MLGFGRRPTREVVVFSREGCHLCDEALKVLARYRRRYGLRISVEDISRDRTLLAQYEEKIPVVRIDGRDRFYGRVDEVLLRRVLDRSP